MAHKQCCAKEIKAIWDLCGGSENIVRHEGKCSVCGQYIGLTWTSKKDADKFIKKHKVK